MLSQCVSATTYHLVIVIELHNNIRGAVSNVLGVSINLHIIENQSLVPGWVQRCSQLFCCLANMQEGNVCIWIYEGKQNRWCDGHSFMVHSFQPYFI